MTYEQWYSQYLALYKRNLRPKTRESYARIHALISPSLGALDLQVISPDDIQRALLAVEDAAGSRQAQIAFALLHAVFHRAVRSRHVDLSPMDAIDKPNHMATKARVITEEDWIALLPAVRSSPGLALMAFAGLRRGEVLGLRRGDIDFDSGLIHIQRQRIRVSGELILCQPKSTAGIRAIPISPELLPILREATRAMLPSAHIEPCAPETFNHRWRRLQLSLDIRKPYRLHDLRHTYITQLVLAGALPRVVQYVAGHSSLDVTMQIYTHIGPNQAKNELSRLAAALH